MKKHSKNCCMILIAMLIIAFCMVSPTSKATAHAKSTSKIRYTTQKVNLKNKVKGHTVYKVGRNTKVRIVKHGKKWVKVKYKKQTLVCRKKFLSKEKSPKKYTGRYFRSAGVIWWHGRKYTWYSQRILPGYGLKIPGRHLDSQGFVCDKNNYIVLGSNTSNRGKIVATPFGKFGKVYDAGYVGTYWYDCYTNF